MPPFNYVTHGKVMLAGEWAGWYHAIQDEWAHTGQPASIQGLASSFARFSLSDAMVCKLLSSALHFCCSATTCAFALAWSTACAEGGGATCMLPGLKNQSQTKMWFNVFSWCWRHVEKESDVIICDLLA